MLQASSISAIMQQCQLQIATMLYTMLQKSYACIKTKYIISYRQTDQLVPHA